MSIQKRQDESVDQIDLKRVTRWRALIDARVDDAVFELVIEQLVDAESRHASRFVGDLGLCQQCMSECTRSRRWLLATRVLSFMVFGFAIILILFGAVTWISANPAIGSISATIGAILGWMSRYSFGLVDRAESIHRENMRRMTDVFRCLASINLAFMLPNEARDRMIERAISDLYSAQ